MSVLVLWNRQAGTRASHSSSSSEGDRPVKSGTNWGQKRLASPAHKVDEEAHWHHEAEEEPPRFEAEATVSDIPSLQLTWQAG